MELVQSGGVVVDVDAELLALYPGLVRRLTLVLGNEADAQDASQAAFERAFRRRRAVAGNVRAWFYTIGLRLAFNELRRRKRAPVAAIETEPVWAQETDPDLWLALQQLAPEHRAALLLAELDGYSHKEIGRILGVRTGTVSSWLSRSKHALRIALGDRDA